MRTLFPGNSRLISILAIIFLSLGLAACSGDDGDKGDPGPEGPQGPPGPPGTTVEPVAAAEPEACGTCHGDVGEGKHQSVYDKYVDASTLAMTFNSVSSAADGTGKFTVTLRFRITKDGKPFIDGAGLPSLNQKAFYAVQYDSTTRQYLKGGTSLSARNVVPGTSAGDYVLTQTGVPFKPESPTAPFDGSQVYGYIAQGVLLEHEGVSSELPAGTHVHLYDNVANAALPFGTAAATNANAYVSAANVAGCEKCHGTPYLKHGYRAGKVAGLPDFGGCKSCHYDDRTGGHEDWQYMVDDPLNWATAGLPAETVEDKYAYKAKLMNDVHMAHAMEFPYPQSMANCVTCHEGKLDQITANTNFKAETCVSCHPVTGANAWPEAVGDTPAGDYAQEHRAPPLEYLWARHGVFNFHINLKESDCQQCHGNPSVGAPAFSEYHTGYDERIADADGQRYRDLYTVSIDSVTVDGNAIRVAYSANDPDIVPELLLSFYGWDTKDFIVPSHQRDGTTRCGDRGCRFEYAPGDSNPLFTNFEEVAPGSWAVTADLAQWQDGQPGAIPDLIADGTIRRAEVTLTPELELPGHDGEPIEVNLKPVNYTVDLRSGAAIENYFKGANAIVDVTKCEVCHDQVSVTFHEGSGRGGDIVTCRNCHAPVFPGSHIEMASRSIDNYVHAIHSFQAFDTGDIFLEEDEDDNAVPFFDPVTALRYDQHIHHTFPNFTIRNCEACHNEGKFDVPDQSKSLFGVSSRSDNLLDWYEIVDAPEGSIPEQIAVEKPEGRNISGAIPEYVTGPASRACGGCHRADPINADLAGELASFNSHTKMGGTLAENKSDDSTLFEIIDKIMALFQ